MLLSFAAPLHNNLLITFTLIVLGFLGMLLQRNKLATVFSLFLWLQGAGLVFVSFTQQQESREIQLYFLIILFIVITLLCTISALIFSSRRASQKPDSSELQDATGTREGTHPSE